jgi:D-alanyl-D-alanine carboxypeptidase/D-alanyl-D-alanine-endopeptidase (penicillin-binding protein 4)
LVSLPRAGEDGSLKRRLGSWPGTLRAKTGSLRDVKAMAGYATTPAGRAVSFAVLVNGRKGRPLGTARVDRLVDAALRAVDQLRSDSSTAQKGSPIEN